MHDSINEFDKRIKNFDLKYHHKLNFNTGESEEICLLETNSLYYFYVAKNESNIKIAPINAVKYLEVNKNIRPKRL